MRRKEFGTMQDELVIDVSGWSCFLNILFPIIALAFFVLRDRVSQFLEQMKAYDYLHYYVNNETANDERDDCTKLAQAELEKHFAGVINPGDIRKVLSAHDEVTAEETRYSRKDVCRRAFNSVSSDAYGKTKAVLDMLEELQADTSATS
jgi:hypothetical protein